MKRLARLKYMYIYENVTQASNHGEAAPKSCCLASANRESGGGGGGVTMRLRSMNVGT